jgi:phytoene dehydrogenase-like protein
MKVAVVGGGVAGLSCALELRDRGHTPIVLERERLPGGKVRSERRGDWQVEHGPAGVLDDAPETVALLRSGRRLSDPERPKCDKAYRCQRFRLPAWRRRLAQ